MKDRMRPVSEYGGQEKNFLLKSMHKNLEPLKVSFTWMWLIAWPDKRKAQRRFLGKPFKNVRKAVTYGKLKVMRIICLR